MNENNFCARCGAPLPPNAQNCVRCGYSVHRPHYTTYKVIIAVSCILNIILSVVCISTPAVEVSNNSVTDTSITKDDIVFSETITTKTTTTPSKESVEDEQLQTTDNEYHEADKSMYNTKLIQFNSENGYAYFAIEVENKSNKSLNLGYGECDIEDSEGNLLAANESLSSIPAVIEPGEKGYFYTDSEISLKFTPKGDINVISELKIYETSETMKKFDIKDVRYSADSYTVLGRVVNNTDTYYELVDVYALIYDNKHNLIDIRNTFVELMGKSEDSFELALGYREGEDFTYDLYASEALYNTE